MTKHAIQLEQQQELMQALEFNYRDLEANQEGRISYQQGVEIWRRENYRWHRPLLWAMVIGGPYLLILTTGGITDYLTVKNLDPLFCFSGLGGLVVFCFLWLAWSNWRNLSTDIQAREVRQIQGKVDFVFVGGTTLQINRLWFNTNRGVIGAMRKGLPYVIYYLPRSKAIVAIELMER